MSRRRTNIEPIVIRGETEFAAAFGISDPRMQARLRSEGLPCMHDGRMYVYNPAKVLAWMENNWRVVTPEIKPLKTK